MDDGGGGRIVLVRLGTLSVKLPRVLADTVFSGETFQPLVVFGRNEVSTVQRALLALSVASYDFTGSLMMAVSSLARLFGRMLLFVVVVVVGGGGVEISSRTPIPLFLPGSVHGCLAS